MTETIWWVGIGGAFVAFTLIFFLVLFRSRESAGARRLRETLEESGADGSGVSEESASLLRQIADVVEGMQRDPVRKEELQTRLERAGWSLRASELRVIQGGLFAAGLLVGFGLFGSVMLAIGLAAMGAIAPTAALGRKVRRRSSAFEAQLPDVLQLLASSLRAGYGFLQAIDTAATEASEPAASEFSRVVSEARLGGSVEAAMESMAERLDSADFRWVVIAVNIQRQVGGNLAELLDTVAETLREREMLRRQIKVLSAEGRLSAVILIALPIVLTIYLILVRPEYIGTLVTSGLFGWTLVVGASTLMLVGVLWIRKMIQIEV